MSSINPNNINGSYPVAGQDNDSQGFRDNFTNIKQNLTFAKSELEDLQNNALLKAALSGGTLDNNLNYAQLKAPQLIKVVETLNPIGSVGSTATLDWTAGNFQTLTTTSSLVLTVSATSGSTWPTSGFYAKVRVQMNIASATHTVTLGPASGIVFKNLENIQGISSQTITFPAAGIYIFEFSSYDNGQNIVVRDLTRNYNIETTGVSAVFQTANISGTTASTNSTNGALLVPFGGAGIAGNLSVGGNIIANSITTTTGTNANLVIDPDGAGDAVFSTATEVFILSNVASTSTGSGALIVPNGGVAIVGNLNLGANANVASNLIVGTTSSAVGNAFIRHTTAAISNSSGALQVVGGVGVQGNIAYGALLIASPNYIPVGSSATYSLSTTQTDNLLALATTGLTVTVNMPTNPVDGQVTTFGANNSATLALGTGTVSPTFAGAISAGATFKYIYKATTASGVTGATWYRFE